MRIENQEIRNADIFETIIDHFPDIIHSVDGEGNIVFANNRAEELLGYPLEKLLTMNIRQLYAQKVLRAMEEGFDSLKQTGDTAVESVLLDVDGKDIPVEVRSFGIYDDNDQFVRTFSILRDIRELKELQRSLQQAGRLAAIGEVASGIVHDIINPLAVVSLSLQSMDLDVKDLRQAGADPGTLESLNESLDDVGRAADAIQKLAGHLRSFARGIAERSARIDLGQLMDDALFLTKSRILDGGVTVDNQVPRGTCFMSGCPNQIEQVFANLVSNACDAMANQEQRVLTLSIGETTRDREGEPTAYWVCRVADTGPGIPAHLHHDIFESFFTTKTQDKGTGLGLAIVRGIVNDHDGDVTVTSTAGGGATFMIYLPKNAVQD